MKQMLLHSEEPHTLEGPHCIPAQPAESLCIFLCAIFDPPCFCLVIQDSPQTPVKPPRLLHCPVFHPQYLGLVLSATLMSSLPDIALLEGEVRDLLICSRA